MTHGQTPGLYEGNHNQGEQKKQTNEPDLHPNIQVGIVSLVIRHSIDYD
jgi:hypothetical protein